MKLRISGIEPGFRPSVERIIQLFHDRPEVVFDADAPPAADVVIRLQNGRVLFRRTEEPPAGNATGDKHARIRRKRAVSAAVLEMLQEETGVTQPWGVLTGVRPIKLLHGKLRLGIGRGEALAQLAEETLVRERKLRLMERIVDRQLAVLPDLYDLGREVSIYIGIPFCPTKCAYCTFPAYAIGSRQGAADAFLGGLHHEMRAIGTWLKAHGVGVTTVYFGGGTPTSITAGEMDRLYAELHESFPGAASIREVTVEAGRPDTITPEKLRVLKCWNIDRISINPQSYTAQTLRAIGRHHSVEETIAKFWLAREMGMNNINMDLIIGLPGEGTAEFAHTLEKTAELMPESLTIHTLSFKRASQMTQNRDKFPVSDRGEIHRMMAMAESWTEACGYRPYYLYRQKNILGNLENVGYAKPGRESLYNIIIMEEVQTIVGLGCGATSKWIDPATGVITRFANPKEPKVYNEQVMRYTEAKIEALEKWFASRSRPAAGEAPARGGNVRR